MSSCFFCGVGGPETAVELHFKNKPNFKTDQIVAVTGILKLNRDDVEHFNYILTDCTGTLIK
ncbi:homoserine dehydrogenase [Polaribacter atrinae]|uniref:homoserine dehydrogenase n=1 Tax=Polaribacter atrinae TaxID=1333662 RepID=UPI0030F4D90C